MERRTLYVVGGGLALGLAAFWYVNREEPGTLLEQLAATARNWITRGRRLTRTTLDENNDVPDAPADLAAEAGSEMGRPVSLEAYALARMLASEESKASATTKAAIAWVAVNEARRRGTSVSGLLLRDNGPGNGRFGEQRGRYASTRTDPYEGDLQVAEAVLSGEVGDITGGAVHFYRPELQDRLYDLGKTSKTAEQIDREWGGEGFTIEGAEEGLKFYT